MLFTWMMSTVSAAGPAPLSKKTKTSIGVQYNDEGL